MTELSEDCVVYNNTLFVPSNGQKYNGMHVKLSNIIEVRCPEVKMDRIDNNSMKLGFRFVLPMGSYVDLYEIRRRHDWNVKSDKISFDAIKISNFTYNSIMNSEIIAEHFNQSTELFVEFAVASMDSNFNFQYSIPIHLRYHLPSYFDSHKYVFLSSPEVFVNDRDTCQENIGNIVALTIPVGNMNDHVYVYSLSLLYYVCSVLIIMYVVCKSL